MFHETKRKQAAEITPGSDGMVPSAADWRLQQARYNASCRRIDHSVAAGGDGSAQRFVPGDLDLWPWHSHSAERGTRHVLCEFDANPFSGSRYISFTNKQ